MMNRVLKSSHGNAAPQGGATRKLAAAVFLASTLFGCPAPEPTKTGDEFSEFADAQPSPRADANQARQAPTGFARMDCGTDTFGDVSLQVAFDEDDQLVVNWDGGNALGFLVTDRDAILPAGPDDRVQGTAYWVVGTTAFPAGFAGPVTYGHVPTDGEDITAEHGGTAGGTPLDAGQCYKFSVTNNSFATGSVIRGWE